MRKRRFQGILAGILSVCFLFAGFAQQKVFAAGEISSLQLVKEPFGNDFKFQVLPKEMTNQIAGLELDGNSAEKVGSKYSVWGASPRFYVDEAKGEVYTLAPSKDTRFTFFASGNQKIGEFVYHKESNTFEKVGTSTDTGSTGGDTGTQEPPTPPTSSQIERVVETPQGGFSFDPYSVTVTPVEAIKDLDGVEVGTKAYRQTSAKAAVFGEVFYVDKASGKVYLGDKVKDGAVLVLKQGDTILGKFRKLADGTYQKVEGEGLTSKKLHVRLRGTFESALVSQKKYDAVSSATGAATVNKNSNVVVELAETEPGVEPADSDWKLVKDASDIHLDFKKTRLTMSDESMGMKPTYNTYDSAVTLSGIPEKAGKYMVQAEVTDSLGRVATSNELPFRVYDLNEVKLIDQLKQENFVPLTHGPGKYQWDMEPWHIEKFAHEEKSEPSEVEVPSTLKLWHGSHESGVYGVLGYPVEQGKKPHQTLVIGSGTSLTLRNMKVLSSVNILVKEGGKLNFYDSSLYGTITVERGGSFQMNYDEFNKKYLTGSSINGQLILKDGAVLESSTIYSNANHLTDGKVARRIDEPVVKVEGAVLVQGKVYVRGDDSATGTKEDGSLYTGQPAMVLEENATLTISEGSELGLYGGGQWATTSVGGDALIMKEGSQVIGDGKLIAVGGTGQAEKGGDGVSGNGTIATKEAFLQGGNNFSKTTPAGKPYTEGIIISPDTIGYAKDGKHYPTTEEESNSPYWRGLKVPGEDANIPNPLVASDTTGAPTIIERKPLVKQPLALLEAGEASRENEFLVKINGEPEELREVYLDGRLLQLGTDYEVRRGSTILVLKRDLMSSLADGDHTLVANYEEGPAILGGKVEVPFKLLAKKDGNLGTDGSTSKDGDDSKDGMASKDETTSKGQTMEGKKSNQTETVSNRMGTSDKTVVKTGVPKTGDKAGASLYVGLVTLSGAGLLLALRRRRSA